MGDFRTSPGLAAGVFWGLRTYLGLHNSNTVVSGLETALRNGGGKQKPPGVGVSRSRCLPRAEQSGRLESWKEEKLLEAAPPVSVGTGQKEGEEQGRGGAVLGMGMMCCPALLEEGTRGASSPRGCSRSPWPGSPTRHSREATTSTGWGGEQKKASKPLPVPGRRRGEKKRERGGGEFVGICVRWRENAGGPGVSKEPSHKIIAHRTLPGKKIPYFSLQSYYKRAEEIYNKRAHRGPSSSSSSSGKRALSQKKTQTLSVCPQFFTPAESCSLYKRAEEKVRKQHGKLKNKFKKKERKKEKKNPKENPCIISKKREGGRKVLDAIAVRKGNLPNGKEMSESHKQGFRRVSGNIHIKINSKFSVFAIKNSFFFSFLLEKGSQLKTLN